MDLKKAFDIFIVLNDVTYTELAEVTGMSLSQISQLKGKESIKTLQIEKIIKPFDNWTVSKFLRLSE